ncbi:cell division protein Fic [Alphaproteobacteria bacterium]|nr:cell division protein Fic [Alphaproteobacteria bacterium]
MYFHYDAHSTPVKPEEIRNLIPLHIQTQDELNVWEQNNISEAETKFFKSSKGVDLTLEFIKKVHKSMFNHTWKWAGKFRTTHTNLGIEWIKIPQETKLLCEDFTYQIVHHSYSLEEIAIRFSHRFVCIHPFFNGNGRCSRLLTDLISVKNGLERFTWGRKSLTAESETREKYIQALKEADHLNIQPLIDFAKS